MPFAQSSELPPPRATMTSMPCGAAMSRPRATIAESGFSPKSWNVTTSRPATSSSPRTCATYPAATMPGIGHQQRTASIFGGQGTDPVHPTCSENDARARVKLKRLHRSCLMTYR